MDLGRWLDAKEGQYDFKSKSLLINIKVLLKYSLLLNTNGAIEKQMNLTGVTILQIADHKVIDQLRLDKDVFGMEQKFLR